MAWSLVLCLGDTSMVGGTGVATVVLDGAAAAAAVVVIVVVRNNFRGIGRQPRGCHTEDGGIPSVVMHERTRSNLVVNGDILCPWNQRDASSSRWLRIDTESVEQTRTNPSFLGRRKWCQQQWRGSRELLSARLALVLGIHGPRDRCRCFDGSHR